jgi:hydroxymethylpyrimidine/phosphomethylpyrimidine kinase
VYGDFSVAALKTGALGNAAVIMALAEYLRGMHPLQLVIDPVMISKHGDALLNEDAVTVLRDELFPLALVVTPNLHEAAALAGINEVHDRKTMLTAANAIAAYGCRAVVVKGGHMAGEPADLLWYQNQATWIAGERLESPHTHGTGCTFSAAITANLARGIALPEAVQAAKVYVAGAIRHGQLFGQGVNPVNHFWQSDESFGAI